MRLPAELHPDVFREDLRWERESTSRLDAMPHAEHLPGAKALFCIAVSRGRDDHGGDTLSMSEIGEVVAGFEILDLVGAGGMGRVFRARCTKTSAVVALKTLSHALGASPEAVRRFQREAEAVKRLSHPNIVRALASGEDRGIHFLAMEFVEGKDLGAVVCERGPLDLRDALSYVAQAARGLQCAHEHEVVHRDLKPSNLLLTREGAVKVTDLGVARIAESELSQEGASLQDLTVTPQLLGSFAYMPPEQAADPRNVDCRADIYALGCTLFHLLTGKPPYSGRSWLQVVLAHHHETIPVLRLEPSGCPETTSQCSWDNITTERDGDYEVDEVVSGQGPKGPEDRLNELIQHMLAKQPKDRYDSMNDVVQAIESFPHSKISHDLTVHVWSSASESVVPNSLPDRHVEATITGQTSSAASRRRRTLLVAALTAVLMLLAVGVAPSLRFHLLESSSIPERINPAVRQKLARDAREESSASASDDGFYLLRNGWQVGTPVNLGPAVNSVEHDGTPFISLDGLTLLFSSLRESQPDNDNIWICKRPSIDVAFKEPVLLDARMSEAGIEAGPAMSADGTIFLWHSNGNIGDTCMDIWMAERPSFDKPLSSPRLLGGNINTAKKECGPHLSTDGLRLYFASAGRGGEGATDLYMSSRDSLTHPFREAVNLGPAVNSPCGEWQPTLTDDECVMVFTSKRNGGFGQRDLWMATRPSVDEAFGEPCNLGPTVNTLEDNEAGAAISADGRELYFAANRPENVGSWDIWMVPLVPPERDTSSHP